MARGDIQTGYNHETRRWFFRVPSSLSPAQLQAAIDFTKKVSTERMLGCTVLQKGFRAALK